MNRQTDRNRHPKAVKTAILLLLIAAVGVFVYFTSFYHMDVLQIEDGKAVGAKPTWLIGHFAEDGGEARQREKVRRAVQQRVAVQQLHAQTQRRDGQRAGAERAAP